MDGPNTPAEGGESDGAGFDEVDAFLSQIQKQIRESGPPQRTELFGLPVEMPLPPPGQATTPQGEVPVDHLPTDFLVDRLTQRWGTGGGKTNLIQSSAEDGDASHRDQDAS
ncbi:hypothetical protein [Saccharopolyspora griseoalba]|uniref:Uncharacterized protein n=1 Tax=Saccharopolyspora griseoalba TaxID=1431848 RepID=A0ABW2LSS0_9PSEU